MEKFFGEEPIIAATVRLTKACNLRCPHCYVNAGKIADNELSCEELKSVVDQLAALKVFYVFYTGGEPFSRKDIAEILNYADKKGVGISISTNGSLLNKEILNKIKNIKFDLFQISLDGSSKIHESIRGKGMWNKTMSAIELSKKILKNNIGIGTVIMKDNWKILDKVLEEGVSHGIDIFDLMCLIIAGRATKDLGPTSKEFLKSLELIFDKYEKLQSKVRFAKDTTIPPALVPKAWRDKGIHKTFSPCSFPYYIAIDSNGNIAPCDGLFDCKEMIIGNVRKDSIKNVWEKSKLLKKLRKINPSDLKGVCKKCIYKDYCAGGCRAAAYNTYKDFTMPDPICQDIYDSGDFPKECLKQNNK